jgi:hypothetical protein
MSPTQVQAYWTAFTDEMLAQVLLAVAGIVGPTTAAFLGLNTWAAQLQTDAQNALNTANSATGSAQTALNQLQQIPAQTVVPDLTAGAASVSPDNAGSGGSTTAANGTVTNTLAAYGTQTVGPTASIMVAAATYSLVGSAFGSSFLQAVVGGTAMQSVGVIQMSGITEFAEFFILWNPPVGTNKAVSVTGWGTNGAGIANLSFESATYIGATSVVPGGLTSNTGAGTSLSLPVPAAVAGTMAVCALSAGNATTKADTTLSAFNETQRGNVTEQVNSLQYGYQSLAFGDAAGVLGGPTFTAIAANTASWVGAALVLSAQATIGSGFRAANTTASAVAATAGVHMLPFGFFNSVAVSTDDYSGTGTGNTVVVAQAGWYKVKIGLLTHTYSGLLLGPALFVNGTAVEIGLNIAPSAGAIISDTFLIYLNVGDTLAAGYDASTTYSDTFIGETTGTRCYWSVSLLNRSLL